jgi:putative endonuclease
MASYIVYILYSEIKNRYYIGSTSDLSERVRRHNTNHKGYTGGLGDWKLAYSESYPDKTSALQREKQIKAWKSRERIKKLIKNA